MVSINQMLVMVLIIRDGQIMIVITTTTCVRFQADRIRRLHKKRNEKGLLKGNKGLMCDDSSADIVDIGLIKGKSGISFRVSYYTYNDSWLTLSRWGLAIEARLPKNKIK